MKLGRVCTVMSFVEDPAASAQFWSEVLGADVDARFSMVEAAEVKLFFHPADQQRNPQGGTVAYFAVAEFDHTRELLLAAGCVLHRGPVAVAEGQRICQVRDPFGTIWGLEEVSA